MQGCSFSSGKQQGQCRNGPLVKKASQFSQADNGDAAINMQLNPHMYNYEGPCKT